MCESIVILKFFSMFINSSKYEEIIAAYIEAQNN